MDLAAPTSIGLEARPRQPHRFAWLMSGGFLLLTVVVLLGHIVGFMPGYALLQQVCATGCVVTPANALALQHLGLPLPTFALIYSLIQIPYFLLCLGAGTLIVLKKSGEWVALGFGVALLGLSTFEGVTFLALMRVYPFLHLPLFLVFGLVGAIFGNYALLTFPDGRFHARWVRIYYLLSIAVAVIPPTSTGLLALISGIATPLSFPLLIAVWVARYRRSTMPRARAGLKWLITCMVVFLFMLIGCLALQALAPADSPAFLVVDFLSFFGCSINIFGWLMAILYVNALDIDVIISRATIFGVLSVLVVGLYVGMVVGLGQALPRTNNILVSLLATGLIAVVFHPLRTALQRRVNRFLYGEREDPYHILARLDQQLLVAMPPDAILPTLCRRIAIVLKLPYVAVQFDAPTVSATAHVVAAYGHPSPIVQQVPLVYQGETIGALLFAPRSGESVLPRQDQRLLADVAQHAGVIAHAIQLTHDLQRSRERIVVAREEERRRLRRDLHDGLGPLLASLPLTLAAAREYLAHDPERSDALLQTLAGQIQGAVTDIRRLVYELRPPALDDLGLVDALRDQINRFAQRDVSVQFQIEGDLIGLPAAVEVAAYRIVLEAVTNVMRHAAARTCTVSLRREREVVLEIRDDGIGVPVHGRRGVGMQSMRERAEELGGTCAIAALPAGGTLVHACLPVEEETHDA